MEKLKRPLGVELRKSKANFQPIAIRPMLLAKDGSSFKPYIVVFCPACVRSLVENYFARPESKRLYQPGMGSPVSFDVIVDDNPIRPTTSQRVHSNPIRMGYPASEPMTYRNTHLKMDSVRGARYATMGGYIVVIGKDDRLSMYGLTAGHSIVQEDLEEEIQREQASQEPNSGPSLFPGLDPSALPRALGSAASRTMDNTSHGHPTNSQEDIEWSGNSKVAPASFSTQARNRDWALLEAMADQPDRGFQFEEYRVCNPVAGDVYADTQAGIDFQPPFIGKLSFGPSYAILPYGNDFVRVHTITLHDSRSKQSDRVMR